MRELRIELPFPPAALSPNARGHWAEKYHATKSYRRRAGDEAGLAKRLAGMTGRWARAEVAIVAFSPRASRLDEDNLVGRLKPAFDGLEDAGVVANDRDLVLGPVTIMPGPERLALYVRVLAADKKPTIQPLAGVRRFDA